MRHLKKRKKSFFIRSLLNNFVKAEKIATTEARAKEIRPLIEKIITRAKKDTVSNRRLVARMFAPLQVRKLFSEIAPRYAERKGGYTRVSKLGRRKTGDASPMAMIELV